ncbi:polyphosphate kinase 1 [Calditerrivibrio nitroreducens]|uniref:Polyphosphate kinase n=1 Tax=Calditerrivibrio nitroreducens (strain DSM 19672 / NBRC 101217 / Yu37-1) TaxID=768670 RepID=E4TFA8_CALNY|nr:polyphosphate kinase 1 [Calditerrivibrio nitroreducens]ADR18447.1 Polyphosphate kinase [Calditerrivibrio nitroreducens DSM 19672]
MTNKFFNRELSWLAFNERVLLEATDPNVPLLEKLKFIGIFSSNLDEFFMIRVAGLMDQVKSGYNKRDLSGLTPSDQLAKIREKVVTLIKKQSDIFTEILAKLNKEKIFFNSNFELFPIDSIFFNEILPVITPITISPANPFPFIHNLNMNIFSIVKKDGEIFHSVIIIPGSLKRFFIFQQGESYYIFLTETIIQKFLKFIYPNFEIVESFLFRITRNADLNLNSEEVEDLYKEIQNSLIKRAIGSPVRMEVLGEFKEESLSMLMENFELKEGEFYKVNEIIDYTFLMKLDIPLDKHRYPKIKKSSLNLNDKKFIFNYIKNNDILLFRPYDDLTFVSQMVSEAAEDPDVIAIKMTLYRANKDSSIIKSLEKAALSGKHVCVVIELKARFDEEKNLEWAKKLEHSGCIVSYGFVDLKIHAKALLIVKKDKGKIVRYTHLSTGNYNELTANLYTDIDFITSNDAIGSDVVKLFNFIMSYSDSLGWDEITVAPIYLREKLYYLIDNEIENAKKGDPAKIIVKLNSLYDESLTLKLYEASNAGVQIDLIVRGICSLVPGVKGLSENIRVKSIIGRFLEHPRVLYFHNKGNYKIFLSTADWMMRNLDKRVEVLFEIKDHKLKEKLFNYLQLNLKDNQKSWVLNQNGIYKKQIAKSNRLSLQEEMHKFSFIL